MRSSTGIGGALPLRPLPLPFLSALDAPGCVLCGAPAYGAGLGLDGWLGKVLARGARCSTMVGSDLSSNSLSPRGYVPSGCCLTAPIVDASLVKAALSHIMIWWSDGFEYPGGGSLCIAWIKNVIQVLCCEYVINLANLNAMPLLDMAKRNCISLEVGATSLSSLSLITSDPPSKESSFVLLLPCISWLLDVQLEGSMYFSVLVSLIWQALSKSRCEGS